MTAAPLADALAGARRELELAWAAEEQREVELTQAERYARDPVGWINDHVVIASKFDPDGNRVRVHPVKMRLFPDQVATIAGWIELDHLTRTGELRLRNEAIDKSRQIGETWLFAAVVAWILHYHAARGLFMHVRAAEVCDRQWSIDSFFGRIRYIDRLLDRAKVPGLGALSFRPFSGTGPASIERPDTGSTIRGECQRDDPGRGSTFDYAIVDEAARVQHGEAVHASLDDACPEGKVYLSTPEGDDNMHARIVDARPAGWRILRLHWSTHPNYSQGLHVAAIADSLGEPQPKQPSKDAGRAAAGCRLCEGNRAGIPWDHSDPRAHRYPGRLTSPWYDKAVVGKTDEQVAQELDIDRERALTGRVFSEFSSELHVVELIDYDPELELELAGDFGLDATSIVICQDAPAEYRVIGEIEMGDLFKTTATPDRVVPAIVDALLALGLEEKLTHPRWLKNIHAIGDPAAQSRSMSTGRPWADEYRKLGIDWGRPPQRLAGPGVTVEHSIKAVKRLLLGTPKPLRICATKCPQFVAHARNNRWPTDARGRRRPGATKPEDDVHNHMMRGFAYLAVQKFPPPVDERTQEPAGPAEERTGRDRGILDEGLRYGMSL